jgi:hypothetical protein
MATDSYATTTEAFYHLHLTHTTAGETLTQVEYNLLSAKRALDAAAKTAWSSSTPPDAVKEVCLRIFARGWAFGEQTRLARGAATHNDLGVGFTFPRGNAFYVTKDDMKLLFGSTSKTTPAYVGGAYVTT